MITITCLIDVMFFKWLKRMYIIIVHSQGIVWITVTTYQCFVVWFLCADSFVRNKHTTKDCFTCKHMLTKDTYHIFGFVA